MREKDRLDLNKIEAIVKPSPTSQVLSLATRGAQGASTGLGIAGGIASTLALAGITTAFLLQAVAGAVGAGAIGLAAMGYAGYRLWQHQKDINNLKTIFDEQLTNLKNAQIEAIKNYQFLDEKTAEITAEINRTKDRNRLQELEAYLQEIQQGKEQIIARMRAVLAVVVGESDTDKLSQLFGESYGATEKLALHNYAKIDFRKNGLLLTDKELLQFDKGLDKVWDVFNQAQPSINQKYQDELNTSIKPEYDKSKTSKKVKNLIFTVAGATAFLGGSGIAFTVGTILVGGSAAALVAFGWPVLLGVAAAGLVAMAGSLLYYRYVEKKQAKNLKTLTLANKQIKGMSTYLNDNVNRPVEDLSQAARFEQKDSLEKLAIFDVRQQSMRNADEIYLNKLQKEFAEYQQELQGNIGATHSLEVEIGTFHTDIGKNYDDAQKLKAKIEENIADLRNFNKRIVKEVMPTSTDEEKQKFLDEVGECQTKANEALKNVQDIIVRIEKKLQKVPAAHEMLSQGLTERNQKAPSSISSGNRKTPKDDDESQGVGERYQRPRKGR